MYDIWGIRKHPKNHTDEYACLGFTLNPPPPPPSAIPGGEIIMVSWDSTVSAKRIHRGSCLAAVPPEEAEEQEVT